MRVMWRVFGVGISMAVSAVVAIGLLDVTGELRPVSGPTALPWAQTDGDAALSRANPIESTLTPQTVAHTALWKVLAAPTDASRCPGRPLMRSPAFTSSRLFAIENGQVTMYNAQTGALVWRAKPNSARAIELSSLAVGEGLVVVSGRECRNAPDAGVMYAFNTATGKPAWAIGPGQSSCPPNNCPELGPVAEMVESKPFLVETGPAAGDGQTISVYKAFSGQLLWTQHQDCASHQPLAVVHSLVIVTACDRGAGSTSLEALSLISGERIWTRPGRWRVIRGSDDGADGHVYVINGLSGNDSISDLDATTGITRFHLSGATNVLAVDDRAVYVKCGASVVCGYLEMTGVRLWQTADSSTLASTAGRVLYLADGKVLSASSGQVITRLWPFATSGLAIGDGRIAVVRAPNRVPESSTLDIYALHDS